MFIQARLVNTNNNEIILQNSLIPSLAYIDALKTISISAMLKLYDDSFIQSQFASDLSRLSTLKMKIQLFVCLI